MAPVTQPQVVQFFKTKMCRFHENKRCRYGSTCPFAHSASELEEQPDLSKTSLCRSWQWHRCSLSSEECPFAHGKEELREAPRPPHQLLSSKATLNCLDRSMGATHMPNTSPPQSRRQTLSPGACGRSWADLSSDDASEHSWDSAAVMSSSDKVSTEDSTSGRQKSDSLNSSTSADPVDDWRARPKAESFATTATDESAPPRRSRNAPGSRPKHGKGQRSRGMGMASGAAPCAFYIMPMHQFPYPDMFGQASPAQASLVWDPIADKDVTFSALGTSLHGIGLQPCQPSMYAMGAMPQGMMIPAGAMVPCMMPTYPYASSGPYPTGNMMQNTTVDMEIMLKEAQPAVYED